MTTTSLPNRPESFFTQLFDKKTVPGEIFFAVLFILGAWLAGRALRLAIHRYLDRVEQAGSDPTAIRFLAQLANLGVYIGAFILYSQFNRSLEKLGTAWLASVGVVSVVVGLAAQSTLGNLIAGVSLVLYRPFKIGDRLQVTVPTGLETGTVQSINLGYTVLRTSDGRSLVIPNSAIASQASINLAEAHAGIVSMVSVTVAANSDLAAARKILTDLARANPKMSDVTDCQVTALSAAGATLTLSGWCADAAAAAQAKSEVLEAAQRQFDAAGLKVA